MLWAIDHQLVSRDIAHCGQLIASALFRETAMQHWLIMRIFAVSRVRLDSDTRNSRQRPSPWAVQMPMPKQVRRAGDGSWRAGDPPRSKEKPA